MSPKFLVDPSSLRSLSSGITSAVFFFIIYSSKISRCLCNILITSLRPNVWFSISYFTQLKWSGCYKDFLVGKYSIIFGYSIPTLWKTKIINPTHPPKKSPDIVMERSCSKVGLIRYPLWGRQRAFSWAGITNARLKTSRKEEYSSSDVCKCKPSLFYYSIDTLLWV